MGTACMGNLRYYPVLGGYWLGGRAAGFKCSQEKKGEWAKIRSEVRSVLESQSRSAGAAN